MGIRWEDSIVACPDGHGQMQVIVQNGVKLRVLCRTCQQTPLDLLKDQPVVQSDTPLEDLQAILEDLPSW